MAIFGEPAAKRRRLVDHSEDLRPGVNSAATDDESLVSELMAVSPFEIVTIGSPIYEAILSTHRLLASGTAKRLFGILSQHLECCMSWRANDTDELDDQDLYGSAVKAIILCLQHMYSPGVTELSMLVLARALVFLQRHEEAEVASDALLQIIHFQLLSNENIEKDGLLLPGLSTFQQQEFIAALLQANSKTSTKILTILAGVNKYANIALQSATNETQPGAPYPQTLLETLFEWRCNLLKTTGMGTVPKIDILGTILTSKTTSWQERAQAVEVLTSISGHSYSSELVSVTIEVVLLASPEVSSLAVASLQNLLDDCDRIGDCMKRLEGRILPFLFALLRTSQEPLSREHLLPNHDVGVWACELLWTFISFLVSGDNGVVFDSQGVSELALSSVDICAGDEYKLYLAAKTICRDHWEYFMDESRLSSLVTALSLILNDKEASEVSIGYVLNSLQDLVGSELEASSIVARDRDLLDRIASLGAIASDDEASKLLFKLSDHAPNRRLLICRPRVLIAMMRYAQLHRVGTKSNYFQMRVRQLADLF